MFIYIIEAALLFGFRFRVAFCISLFLHSFRFKCFSVAVVSFLPVRIITWPDFNPQIKKKSEEKKMERSADKKNDKSDT